MKYIFLILSLLLTNCVFKEMKEPKDLGSLAAISKSKAPVVDTASTPTVTGKHCRYTNFYAGNHPQISLAIEDAIAKSPDAKGLKNAKVSFYLATGYGNLAILIPILGLIGFPLNESCYIVEGIPSK